MSRVEKILIFDTTLRDGEQSPGASLISEEKMEIARKLQVLGVDVIEAGFPFSSPGDFESVRRIAREITGPVIAGLARARREDIERCWEAVKESPRPRIHTFIGTSPVHREGILGKSREEILSMAVEAVKIARDLCEDVEFSAMDATRTEPDYLFEVVEKCIEAGAGTINIADTVGYATPEVFGALIRDIKANVPNIDEAVISVHCHNDLGLATANSVAAVVNGARQVECSINGLGERAGNASLEEVVMVLKTRSDVYPEFQIDINTKEIWPASRLVSQLTGIPVQPNKPIVGANAFAHSSGIHQDGVLKHKSTFEIIQPEDVGVPGTKMILTSRSGKAALRKRFEELGCSLSDEEFAKVYAKFKVIADRKKEVYDEDLLALLEDERGDVIEDEYKLVYVHAVTGNSTIPTATVIVQKGDAKLKEAACGDGPVDAVYKAIDRITGIEPELKSYTLQAVTGEKEALGEVSVSIEYDGRTYPGRATSTDIVEASAKAYLRAVNRIVERRK